MSRERPTMLSSRLQPRPHSLEQRQIVSGVIAGDNSATEAFVREYEPRIKRAVREARIPAADAQDVVQDVLIEAIRQLSAGKFEERAALGTWLRRIISGRVVDYWRREGRRGLGKRVPIESLATGGEEFMTPASQDATLLVEDALEAMPIRHRLAITAHCRGQVPVEDLARLFGVSVDRTRGIVTEAKAMFREHVLGSSKRPRPQRLLKQDR
jgi:RNA polymerase sigma factor (sigma-70 family)